jgi:hypothetical protein
MVSHFHFLVLIHSALLLFYVFQIELYQLIILELSLKVGRAILNIFAVAVPIELPVLEPRYGIIWLIVEQHSNPAVFFVVCEVTLEYCTVFAYHSCYAAKLSCCVDLSELAIEFAGPSLYILNFESDFYWEWSLDVLVNFYVKYLVLN